MAPIQGPHYLHLHCLPYCGGAIFCDLDYTKRTQGRRCQVVYIPDLLGVLGPDDECHHRGRHRLLWLLEDQTICQSRYPYTVKPILREHCHERPPVLKDHLFLTEGPAFQYNWPTVLRNHICMFNGVVFQDRFYCILFRLFINILVHVHVTASSRNDSWCLC